MSSTSAFSLPFVNQPGEPQLKDVLDALKNNIFLTMNVHHVATIQAFNAANQTATATINYKKTFYQLNALTGVYSPVLVDYPVLMDCPVICVGGGAGALTFPIAKGDECIVLFNDRDFDNWFSGGTGTGTATTRLHSFADGIIVVGLRSRGNVLSNYDTTRAVLRNGTAEVAVGGPNTTPNPNLIKIANATGTLGSILSSLISALAGQTTIPAVIGAPLPLAPTVIDQLNLLQTQIQELLE